MQVPATERRSVQVGPFVVDFLSHELRNHNRKIPLQEKPFQVLAILLDRPGELVTREVLREKLWPADTFVDFEHSINTAVRKLRDALEDRAEEPRFIETVPRLGYRLIASVSESPFAEIKPLHLASAVGTAVVVRETSPARWRHGRYLFLAGTAVVVVGMLLFGLNVAGVREQLLRGTISAQDTIVVADFSNSTGDPLFDDTLKQALTIALKQSPFLNMPPENKVAATLRWMDRPADTVLTGEVIRQLCQRVGSKAYIAGSIAKLDGEYVLGLKAVNCHSGNLLAKELTTVARKEQVLDALGKEAAKIRGQLGESLATVRKFDVPLAEATTSSLEALKAYSLGAKADGEKGPGAALPFDLRAVQLDPNFALAYLAAGAHYLDLAEPGRASEYFTKAFQLRAREDEREKVLITTFYYFNVTGELDKAGEVLEERLASYPREVGAYNNLAIVYALEGQYEKAMAPNLQSLRRAPDNVGPYTSFTNTQLALQRFDEARQLIGEAHARKLDDYLLHNALYALAFLGKDSSAMADQQQWFTGKAEENLGLSLASDTEAYAGHLDKARDLTKRAADSAIQVDSKETAAIWQENAGLREAAFSNATRARQAAAEGLKLGPESYGVAAEAALAFAMAGDSARAESLEQSLNKRFPQDTQMRSLWLPAIRAQLALNRKNPAGALSHLQPATGPIELGQITFVTNLSCLSPTYIRGQAYLASGQGNSAAAEFQKILDHDGLVWNCWTGVLARLGVARANALAARTSRSVEADAARARALAAYRDFLTLWKHADPDIPILKQAKAEYAKLQ
jgi:DNA-binding winged helix-turn-helix (wHTH) protein/Tfp pilus assembly protein PilF